MSLNKSIFYTFLTQIPTQILGIISGIFITRLLGPQGKGTYTLFIADIELFVLFFGLSINSAIVYFINSKKIRIEKLVAISIILAGVGIFGSVFIILLIHIFGWSSTILAIPSSINYILILLIFGIASTLVNSTFSGFFMGFKQFKLINQLAIINSLLNISFFGGLFFVVQKGIINASVLQIILVTCLVLLLNSSFYIISYLKKIAIKPNFNITYINELKHFGKFLGISHLSQLINFLNYRIDLWIMNYYLDQAQIGYYALAGGFASLIMLITTPIVNVINPSLIETNKTERLKLFKNFAQFNFTLAFLSSIILFFLAPLLIPFLYGNEFKPAIPLFQIILPAIIFTACTKVFALISIASNRLEINLWATIAGLVFTIFFDFLLIPRIGAMGASITSLITYFIVFLTLIGLQLKNNLIVWDNYFILTIRNMKQLKKYFYDRE